jgi:sec-independent protein translocase protein TatB
MPTLGWTELLLIGIVALIVVGPKDLPVMFRTLGQFTGKLRAMARDFQRSMEAAADEAGVKDMANDLRRATDAATNPGRAATSWTKAQVMGEGDAKPADGDDKPPAPQHGPATQALSAEREEARKRILEHSAEKARARQAAEAAAMYGAAGAGSTVPQDTPPSEEPRT